MQSFKNIGGWIKQIESNTSETVCKILIGTKSDLEDERQVEEEEAKKLADKHNMLFLEVSAKSGRNVEETFVGLTREIKNRRAATGDDEEPVHLKITSDKAANKCLCWSFALLYFILHHINKKLQKNMDSSIIFNPIDAEKIIFFLLKIYPQIHIIILLCNQD